MQGCVTQDTVPITLLEVAITHQQTVKIYAADTWRNDSRKEILCTPVSEAAEKKTAVTSSQSELTDETQQTKFLTVFTRVPGCWLQETPYTTTVLTLGPSQPSWKLWVPQSSTLSLISWHRTSWCGILKSFPGDLMTLTQYQFINQHLWPMGVWL